ncbi:Aldo keto reductase [Pyrrhoderma noxium]|uniref:Aldo keto reductase n=1 Tax=Pyrrhoderma noxium TaxID=2282107 RepID=A0A286UER7_9AGAM|nr:Aldo keto reductase [Pyrrhoderma noxium]
MSLSYSPSQDLTLQSSINLRSGFSIPILGLGVFENDDCYPACIAALRHGYRQIDTAEYYQNEAEVGRAVLESGIPREDVFITTKVYHPMHGYDSTLKVIQESLTKLNTPYIDLYLLHSALSGKQKRLDSYRALVKERDEGRIKSIGVSNYGVHHLLEIRNAGLELPSVNQIELHPFCQQRDIVAFCTKNNIVIQAYCPLIRGDFSNLTIQEISQATGKSVPQVLIRWSLQHGFIPLPKSANIERVISNVNVFDFVLSEEHMKKIDDLDMGKEGARTWNPVDAP